VAHRRFVDKVFQSVLVRVLKLELVVVCEKSKEKEWHKGLLIVFLDILQDISMKAHIE
jgi:hypothetical protein